MSDGRDVKITRRDLLGGATAAAAFTIVPRRVLGGAGNAAPSEKVNVAIIGTGGQGTVNMKQLFNEPDVHIAALCDINEESDYSMYYYGGTAGLITLENVLEELVGDINDEFDTEQAEVRKVRDGEYLVDGTMSLHDFARMFDVVPTSREVVTVGGYAFHLLGRIPEKGATLTLGRWVATVDAVASTVMLTATDWPTLPAAS